MSGSGAGQTKTLTARGLPPEYTRPSAAFQDPELSLVAIRRLLSANGNTEPYLVVVEPGADYYVQKDDYGRILGKITKAVYCTYRDKKTGNCYYIPHTFRRAYEGGGKYGPVGFGSVSDGPLQIDCAQAKGVK